MNEILEDWDALTLVWNCAVPSFFLISMHYMLITFVVNKCDTMHIVVTWCMIRMKQNRHVICHQSFKMSVLKDAVVSIHVVIIGDISSIIDRYMNLIANYTLYFDVINAHFRFKLRQVLFFKWKKYKKGITLFWT